MNNLTATIETEKHCGYIQPKFPWDFAKKIQRSQQVKSNVPLISILFNKGRYFEVSIYDPRLIRKISLLTGIKIQYDNMIVGSWKQLERFVRALNILQYYVSIDVDWI